MQIKYFKIPLDFIPFKEIPSLKDTDLKFVYASYLSLLELMNIDLYLISVYDFFGDVIDLNELHSKRLLFGEVIAERPGARGKSKFVELGYSDRRVVEEQLPDMKYSNSLQKYVGDSSGNWFFIDKGKYFIIRAKKSNYEEVKHLEDITMHNDGVLRLRIVMELLKKNVRAGLITLKYDEFREIAFNVIKADLLLRGE